MPTRDGCETVKCERQQSDFESRGKSGEDSRRGLTLWISDTDNQTDEQVAGETKNHCHKVKNRRQHIAHAQGR